MKILREQMQSSLNRRAFIKLSAIAGGGLLVACGGGGGSSGGGGNSPQEPITSLDPPDDPVASGGEFQPHAYIKIARNNVITIIVGPTELGQGILTAIPQIVADELDADWDFVGREQAPPDLKYRIPEGAQLQLTAASFSVRGLWNVLTKSGALIRQRLIEAAAQEWNTDPSTLRTERSFVYDDTNNRLISYGELADKLAEQSILFDPALPLPAQTKQPSEYTIIGQSKKRLDGPEKADGSQQYGLDLYEEDLDLDDLKIAVVARPPRFGDLLLSVGDTSAALAVPGVISVHRLTNSIAVLAENFWAAEKGREALNPTWNSLLAEKLSTSDLPHQYNSLNQLPGFPIRADGFVAPAGASRTENYFFPFYGHAPMEPLNVIIDYTGTSADIWMASQWPDLHKIVASLALGLLPTSVNFNILLAGGGFGRRGNLYSDLVLEACAVAKAVRLPVKVVWSREDDIQGGYYRPASACRMEAFYNGDQLDGWGHRVTSQAILVNSVVETVLRGAGGLGDEFFVTGLEPEVQTTQGAFEMPYEVPNVRVDQHAVTNQVPVLWVRSVANSTNIYAVETFFDLTASDLNRDPYQMRLDMLQNKPRHLAMVKAVGDAIGYTSHTGNTSWGFAVFNSYDSVICTAIEISISPRDDGQRTVTLHRVVSAVDVGRAINPDLLTAQIESGIVFGLGTVMFGEITLENGYVQQSNYDDFRVMRMFECPPMETLVLDSGEEPGGAGELGVPCAGPALANAIFAATGEMITTLPMAQHGWVFE